MTTSSSPSPPRTAPRVALRIRLNNGFSNGELSGAWWPQSRDAEVEITDLADHFPGLIGRISRLLYSRPDWDRPRGRASLHRVQTAAGSVKVGSFSSDDTHLMVVVMASGERFRLVVVPSDLSPTAAGRVMERAADERCRRSPAELLGISSPDQSEIGADIWDGDAGGSL